ncbi:MAG: hypothetical protein JSR76_05875 [Verrucomicrobia bacterium]|nr:hypothetical protein [Verrucomicrobiota bacterium]
MVFFYHLFNMNFERELVGGSPGLFFTQKEEALLSLPSYWKQDHDLVFPEKPKEGYRVEAWGPSPSVKAFAEKHNLIYEHPPMEVVKRLHSKETAHNLSPLPHSKILKNEEDLRAFQEEVKPPYVFKELLSFSGKGHRFQPTHLPFPVLAEPWVTRSFDFSTQWFCERGRVTYLGACVLLSDERGRYKGSQVARDEEELFGKQFTFLEEHIAFVRPFLEKETEFFGNIGIDAFVYENRLQPLCEINCRKTFGWVSLKILEKHPDKEQVTLTFAPSGRGIPLLSGKKIPFQVWVWVE